MRSGFNTGWIMDEVDWAWMDLFSFARPLRERERRRAGFCTKFAVQRPEAWIADRASLVRNDDGTGLDLMNTNSGDSHHPFSFVIADKRSAIRNPFR
jgi:hypothetical protein